MNFKLSAKLVRDPGTFRLKLLQAISVDETPGWMEAWGLWQSFYSRSAMATRWFSISSSGIVLQEMMIREEGGERLNKSRTFVRFYKVHINPGLQPEGGV